MFARGTRATTTVGAAVSLVLVLLGSARTATGQEIEVGVSGDYVRWSSSLPEGAPGGTADDRVTFQSQVGVGLGVSWWLGRSLGLRASGSLASTSLVRTADPLFGTDRTGTALDPDVRLFAATGELLFRPFGARPSGVRLSPYLTLGGGLTWIGPRDDCDGSGADRCASSFVVDDRTYLLERRVVPTAVAALGLQLPLHPAFGLTLEVGDRLMRSPMRHAESDGSGAAVPGDRVDRLMHGPYARIGFSLAGGAAEPEPPGPSVPILVEAVAEVERDSAPGAVEMGEPPSPSAARAPAAAVAAPDTLRLADLGAVVDSSILVPVSNPVRETQRWGARAVSEVAPVTAVAPLDSVPPRPVGNDGFYDVVLDVPNLSVDEITLEVNNLHAHVSLDAKVAKLVSLNVGADAGIERVYLGIRGVQAEAHLKVDLDNVTAIVDRVLTTIDRNPEIISGLLETLETTVTTVGSVANTALQPGGVVSQAVQTVGSVANTALQPGGVVSQAVETVGGVANTTLQPGGVASQLAGSVGATLENVTGAGGLLSAEGVDALGNTLTRTVDGTGRILSRTIDQTGTLVGEQVIGSVTQLPVLRQSPTQSGGFVRTVQDVTGAMIEVTLDAASNVLGTRVLQPGRVLAPAAAPAVMPLVAPIIEEAAGAIAPPEQAAIAPLADPPPVQPAPLAESPLEESARAGTKLLLVAMGVDRDGRVVQRVVQPTGTIVSRVIDPITSRVVSSESVGSIGGLSVLRTTTDAAGNLIREVRDESGAVIELTITLDGILTGMRVLKLGGVMAGRPAAPPAAVREMAAPAAPVRAPRVETPPQAQRPDSVPTLLLAQYVNDRGRVVQRMIDAEGNISERSLNAAGQLIVRKRAANARRLPVLRELVASSGDFVRIVQDPTGAVIELTFGHDGKLALVRLLQRGGAPAPAEPPVAAANASVARPVHAAARTAAAIAAPSPAAVAAPVLALLGEGVNAAGHLVQRVIEPDGAIVERTLDAAGRVLQRSAAGHLLQLAVLSRTPQADGSQLLVARDATGTLLEVVLGAGGRISGVRRLDVAAR